MNGARITGILLAVFLMALLSFSPPLAAERTDGKPGPGDPAPPFAAADMEGRNISLDEHITSGNIVLLNFWGLRCANCIVEIGYLNPMLEKYRGEKVVFLGVNVDAASPEVIKQMMPKMANIPRYTVIPDPELKICDLYNLAGAPLSIVIGKDGRIAYRHEDFAPGDEKELEDVLQKALSAGR